MAAIMGRPAHSILQIVLLALFVLGADASKRNFQGVFKRRPTPFTIDVDADFIAQTKQKVALTRFPEEIQQTVLDVLLEGPTVHNATAVKDHWENHYDWVKIQESLNEKFTQFTTTVDISKQSTYQQPVPLHFVHHKSPREDAIPLLFIHGWPGSFLEVGPLIKRLTHPEDDNLPAFHVVAPSIPGFGFSPAPTHPGFGYIESAHAFAQLMRQLGYQKYVIQGGDAGGIIMRYQANLYPSNVVSGVNNFWVVSPTVSDLARYHANKSTDNEAAIIERLDFFIQEHWGYGQLHQTRPLRLAHSIADSPVGLAMWLYDAMWPSVEDISVWTPEDIITWTMMHWIQGPYGPLRIYKEGAAAGAFNATHFHSLPYVEQPMAISEFPKDIWYRTPLEWAQRDGNVKIRYLHEHGGHFPAWENSDLLAGDIQKFFGDEELSGTAIFREGGYFVEEPEENLVERGWNWLREQLGHDEL